MFSHREIAEVKRDKDDVLKRITLNPRAGQVCWELCGQELSEANILALVLTEKILDEVEPKQYTAVISRLKAIKFKCEVISEKSVRLEKGRLEEN